MDNDLSMYLKKKNKKKKCAKILTDYKRRFILNKGAQVYEDSVELYTTDADGIHNIKNGIEHFKLWIHS